MSVLDYKERIAAGADFVQIYTGFIFEGPKLINDILLTKENSRNAWLDAYNSQREAEKAALEFMKQYKGMK